jgi:hypothetical protein
MTACNIPYAQPIVYLYCCCNNNYTTILLDLVYTTTTTITTSTTIWLNETEDEIRLEKNLTRNVRRKDLRKIRGDSKSMQKANPVT